MDSLPSGDDKRLTPRMPIATSPLTGHRVNPFVQELMCEPGRSPAAVGYPIASPREPGNRAGGAGTITYLRLLRRFAGALTAFALLGLAAGAVMTLPQKPIYQAKARLELVDVDREFPSLAKISGASPNPSNPGIDDIQTQVSLLKSETLLRRVLDVMGVQRASDLSPASGALSSWLAALSLLDNNAADPDALEVAQAHMRVRTDNFNRVLELSYDSTNPETARRFVNTLASEFIERGIESRMGTVLKTGDWLNKQLDEMRSNLQSAEDALQSYARQSGLLFTSGRGSVTEEKLSQLQEALSSAQAERAASQSKYEIALRKSSKSLPETQDGALLRDYEMKLTALRQERAELATTFKPEYPAVRKIDAQIKELEAASESERISISERIRNEFDRALRREQLLARNYAAQARLLASESEKSVQYNLLKREVDSARQIYEAMLQRTKEVSVLSAMRASNARIVDSARLPARPYKPNRTLSAALGLVAGFFLGAVYAVVKSQCDRSILEPADLGQCVHAPQLGVVPTAQPGNLRFFPYPRRCRPQHLLTSPSGLGADARLETALPESGLARGSDGGGDPQPAMTESFRAVLTSIILGSDSGAKSQVIVVASCGRREGKTTVVSNLAIALSSVRRRVLLIDGDLRKPYLHKTFGLANSIGLTDLLSEIHPPARIPLETAIHECHVPGLFLLTSGVGSASVSGLIFSPRLQPLLEEASRKFDTVLVDTPPLLEFPDARVMGHLADGVILVARAGKTTADAIAAVEERLFEDGTRVLGTILNDCNPKRAYGDYYGHYGRYGDLERGRKGLAAGA